MTTPVIGVCALVERVRYGVWNQSAALVPVDYIRAIQRAGGVAFALPPDPLVTAQPDLVLDRVDGLLLAGGVDIDPATYGARRHPATDPPNPERDAFEISIAGRAIERDMPFLGICRGAQVLNVARGGTLRQHLPDEFGHEQHRRTLGSFDGSEHDVALAEGSLAARAAGETEHVARSHHHQGIDCVGEGLRVTGRDVVDELPEAIEDPDRRFVLGVQWHPEVDQASTLITALVAEARARIENRPAGS